MNHWMFYLNSGNWTLITEPFKKSTQMLTIDENYKDKINIGDIGIVKITEQQKGDISKYTIFNKEIMEGIYCIVEIISNAKQEYDDGKGTMRSKVEVKINKNWINDPLDIDKIKKYDELYHRIRGYGACCKKIAQEDYLQILGVKIA